MSAVVVASMAARISGLSIDKWRQPSDGSPPSAVTVASRLKYGLNESG